MGFGRALPCIALLSAAAAAGPDEDAKRLWSEYQQLRPMVGWKAFDRRLEILRALGGCDCGSARKTLLQLARTSRSGDERLLSILSLGRILDLDTAKELLRLVERRPEPAITQALADAFAGAKRPDVVAWLGGEALDTKQPDVLRACLEALAALKTPEAAAKVLAIHGSSKDPVLLHEAVRALGSMGGPGARTALLSAASHADFRVRLAAAEVLPACASGDGPMLAAVRALLQDAEPVVRRAAIAAAKGAMLDAVVPDLVDLLEKDPRLRTLEAVRLALKKLCDRDFGHDASAWREWLKTRGDPATAARAITFAQYYGVSVNSDRILFVVDVSGSMSWPWRKEPKRIDVARSELVRVLKEMPKGSLFNVILFSTKVRPWREAEVPADARNVQAAIAWAERNLKDPEGDTYVYDALEEAFSRNPQFDTIFLLSDGQPSHGPYASPEGILACVKVWNRYRGAVVNTVGLTLESLDRGMPNLAEDLRLMKMFVQSLAAGTGGECRLVLQPPR
jgi:HEAT repeat protein